MTAEIVRTDTVVERVKNYQQYCSCIQLALGCRLGFILDLLRVYRKNFKEGRQKCLLPISSVVVILNLGNLRNVDYFYHWIIPDSVKNYGDKKFKDLALFSHRGGWLQLEYHWHLDKLIIMMDIKPLSVLCFAHHQHLTLWHREFLEQLSKRIMNYGHQSLVVLATTFSEIKHQSNFFQVFFYLHKATKLIKRGCKLLPQRLQTHTLNGLSLLLMPEL
mmetsp:Transcript_18976/g.28652  ORF Transcript_18976/g.28652 Transcript_18976/m.28652 type:complete len:218 (-) Transcript_18976:216-869(-)